MDPSHPWLTWANSSASTCFVHSSLVFSLAGSRSYVGYAFNACGQGWNKQKVDQCPPKRLPSQADESAEDAKRSSQKREKDMTSEPRQ